MVFNVYAKNRDDPAKNHTLLMHAEGRWSLSPTYDLTFSSGPGGENCTVVAGQGRGPGMDHLLTISRGASISDHAAKDIIEQLRAAVRCWSHFAESALLSKSSAAELDRIFNAGEPRSP